MRNQFFVLVLGFFFYFVTRLVQLCSLADVVMVSIVVVDNIRKAHSFFSAELSRAQISFNFN